MRRSTSERQIEAIDHEGATMFTTPQFAEAEIAYRQERIKREFGRSTTRRKQREEPSPATPRDACRCLQPTHAA